MKNIVKPIRILAIETSCDETCAAIISYAKPNNQDTNPKQIPNSNPQISKLPTILSNIISSQVDLHAKTGGVVPEVASRAHVERMIPVIQEALLLANYKIQDTRNKQIPDHKSQIQKNNLTMKQLNNDALSQITHIAVTVGPGLIGSLLVGFNTAKSLAYALGVPIVPVNHIEGHIYSALAQNRITNNQVTPLRSPSYEGQASSKQYPSIKSQIQKANEASAIGRSASGGNEANEALFPILALTVSGGHTSLTLMHDHGKYETIGQTLDDAAGEAFDKVAKLLDLGYPGGPALSRVAEQFRKSSKRTGVELPLPLKNDSTYNFSYSGLKTSALLAFRKAEQEFKNDPKKLVLFKQELACVFEETAVAHLIDKTIKSAKKYRVNTVLLAGGVSANKYLREQLSLQLTAYPSGIAPAETDSLQLLLPPSDLCGDNAAMIGLAACYHVQRGDVKNWDEIEVDSNLRL